MNESFCEKETERSPEPPMENTPEGGGPWGGVSDELMRVLRATNSATATASDDPLSRIEGGIAVHCRIDLASRRVVEAATMATLFKGYEALLPGRGLQGVGRVSSTASGICGGVHATASALCLEMALGLTPPPLGIVLRNLLLSCQYLNDNCMHLFVLAGPDYSRETVEATHPELWGRAVTTRCRWQQHHGYSHVGEIMVDLNRGSGALYREALEFVSLARRAYSLLGGKYPHSESIIPGGVTLSIDAGTLGRFREILRPFQNYSRKAAAVWDEVFDFMLEADERYESVGAADATMFDFGQWDHPDYYDARYETCDDWGGKRWATPAFVLKGRLACSRLSLLNSGMEEFFGFSFREHAGLPPEEVMTRDPIGNPISLHHPWNKRTRLPNPFGAQAYSWGSSLTWRGHGFEVGAYARLYLTALAGQLPANAYVAATGRGLEFTLPPDGGAAVDLSWRIPPRWNAFERNRARAYSLAFNLSITLENIRIAEDLLRSGERAAHAVPKGTTEGIRLGVGLWGASRGFLAHWAVIQNLVIRNYQIAIPSRVNAGTRTPGLEPGPMEKALLNTPVIENRFTDDASFRGIDLIRTIQSFDPCMNCSAHLLLRPGGATELRPIETGFPI